MSLRSVLVNLAQILGAGLIVAGVGMVFLPAAVMAAGMFLAFVGWLHGDPEDDDGGPE